jgi:hypothetical protein
MLLYGIESGPKGDRNKISTIIKGKLLIPRNLASSMTETNEIGRVFHLP